MRSRKKYRCTPNYLSVLESEVSSYMTDLITVHTFGGRGSPSF
jgi:hypothetical protein